MEKLVQLVPYPQIYGGICVCEPGYYFDSLDNWCNDCPH